MDIRAATPDDLPAIINLFRISLGEEGGVPEISFWVWKHHHNPFGKSPTLLAFEGDQLVGLRTFLRWRLRYQDELIQAYRAVDTATHPDFQGRGIFKRLTLDMVGSLEKDQPAIIFNTPNKLSRPGYLKMGWQVFGKTPLVVQPHPLHFLKNRLHSTNRKDNLVWPVNLEETWNAISNKYYQLFYNQITTDISFNFLQWRYLDIPGFTYFVHVDNLGSDNCILFYRLKLGMLRELRIADIFFNSPNPTLIKQCIKAVTKKHKPDVVTLLEDSSGLIKSLLPFGFIRVHRFGLPLTYRHVNSARFTELMASTNRLYLGAGSIEIL